MPRPLPPGCHFSIERRILPSHYEMPSFEIATDHYTLGYLLSGDRITVTPNATYYSHSGNVGGCLPFTYHKTSSLSDVVYDSILIKYSYDFAKPFISRFGKPVFEQLYAFPVHSFTYEVQEKVKCLFFQMLEIYQGTSIYQEFLLQAKLFELFILLLEHSLPQNNETIVHATPLTPPVLDAIYYMEKNYSHKLSLDMVARTAGFAPAYFSRIFQAQVGKSYSQYLSAIRLKNAELLLIRTSKSITEIALETGYSHVSNFTEHFKKSNGMTPFAYRKAFCRE